MEVCSLYAVVMAWEEGSRLPFFMQVTVFSKTAIGSLSRRKSLQSGHNEGHRGRKTQRYTPCVKGVPEGAADWLALVERLEEPKLATLDHRHFATMRPRHVEALELLPGS